jgi:streptogramin lyase
VSGGKVGRVNTSGVVTEYSIPTSPVEPEEITTGPDGALWFAEYQGTGIGRLAIVQADGFFTGEQELGTLFYLQFQEGNPFGYYGFLQGSAGTASAWLYHVDLGYEYVTAGDANGDLYFYDLASGHWWYTSSSLFPYLYDFTVNSWLYYFPNTKSPGHYSTNPRYFGNLTTQQTLTM